MTPRRIFTLLALTICSFAFAASSAAAATVVNGTFDDGLNGWTTAVSGDGYWGSVADCNGTGACYRSSTNYGDSAAVMYQDIALEAGLPQKLSFSYKAITEDASTPWLVTALDHTIYGTQQGRVEVMTPGSDPWSTDPADILASIFVTENGTTTDYDWSTINFDLTPWAGQTVRLRFAWTMGAQYLDNEIDNVAIDSSLPKDTTAPGISNAKLSSNHFEAMASGSALVIAKRGKGANLTFDLSEAATVGFSLQKFSRSGGTSSPVAGSATMTGVAGANKAKFTARLTSKSALKPGRYKLLLTATDAAGNASAPTSLIVRVLNPR